jgi:hypothetical protein
VYSKAEASRIRTEFWVKFGQYMKPIPNAQGVRISWPNYKTGVKHIFFRMKAEQDYASIGIEIAHKDEELQELYFDQFLELKKLLVTSFGEEWEWKLLVENEFGQRISRIEQVLPNVNVMEEDDWSKIISFLKPRIIALDEFWENVKPVFES